MDEPPATVLSAKDRRDPEIHWRTLLSSAHLGLEALHFHDVGEIIGDELRYSLEPAGLAFSVVGCGALHRFDNLHPSTCQGAEGVTEGYVVWFREQLLGRLGVSFHELPERQVVLLDYLLQIMDRVRDPPSHPPGRFVASGSFR